MGTFAGCTGLFNSQGPPTPPFESRQEVIDFVKQNDTVQTFLDSHPDANLEVSRSGDHWKLVWKTSGGIPSRLRVTVNGSSGEITKIEEVQ